MKWKRSLHSLVFSTSYQQKTFDHRLSQSKSVNLYSKFLSSLDMVNSQFDLLIKLLTVQFFDFLLACFGFLDVGLQYWNFFFPSRNIGSTVGEFFSFLRESFLQLFNLGDKFNGCIPLYYSSFQFVANC